MGETFTQTRSARRRLVLSPVKPHFVQLLLPGFLDNFSFPKSFLNKYMNSRNLVSKEATYIIQLRSQRRAACWQVKIEGDTDGKVHFNKGWKEFANAHDLCVGDFLVFKYQGNMAFDVLVFAPPGIERDMMELDSSTSTMGGVKPSERCKKKNCDEIATTRETTTTFVPSSYPYYRTTVKPYYYTWPGVSIPSAFVKSHFQFDKYRVDHMALIDEEQQSWKLSLRRRSCSVAMGHGWRQFHAAKGLQIGDSVIFELIESGPRIVMKFYKVS